MKRCKIMGCCLLLGVLALPLPGGSASGLAAQGATMLAAALSDPMAVFAGRSPGERGNAQLVQSKPMAALMPSERVLSPVRDRPAPPIAANLDSLPNRVMEVINPAASPIPGIGMPGNGTSTALPPGTPGSSGGLLPPPGGGGGGGTLPPGPPIPPPPVISAVPEPATWIMMIAGVGMIGWQLRRRRAIGTQAA